MSTIANETGTLSVPAVDPADLLLFGEAEQTERHYTDLLAFFDMAVRARPAGRERVALARAMLYIKTAELRGAEQSSRLATEAQRKFPGRNPALMSLPLDFDQVRHTAPSLWDQHDHLVAVGRALADQALGAAQAVSRVLSATELAQFDRTLSWLFEHKTKTCLVWTERARAIVLDRYPWLADHKVTLELVRRAPRVSSWRVVYAAWDDQPEV